MKKANTDHLRIAEDREKDTHRLECWGCGVTQYISYPITMNVFLPLLTAFKAAHRTCKAPTHIEHTATRAQCLHCGITIQAVQGARVDIPAVIATHRHCRAPVAPQPKPQLPKCPACSRLLDLSSRVSGDTILCTCDAQILMQFTSAGARLSLLGMVAKQRGSRKR